MIQNPQQLPLFPTVVRLQKVVPAENKYRYYRLSTHPTLFGPWTLLREWGRIGCPGTVRADWHDNEAAALDALAVIADKKTRRGYVARSYDGIGMMP